MLTAVALLTILSSALTLSSAKTSYCEAEDKEPWSYHGKRNGPSDWGKTYPKCNGRSQSPIAIFPDNAKDADLEPLYMEGYAEPVTEAKIENNGHTVTITPEDGVQRFIVVEGKKLRLQQLHFHWGADGQRGSEHYINSHQNAMEQSFFNLQAFKPIGDALPFVRFKGDSTQLRRPLDLNGFLPDNPSSFYRYHGSLTTPPCSENVVWSVLKGRKKLGFAQLSMLRSLYSTTMDENFVNCRITDNFRPLQKLNGRTVYSIN